MHIPRLVISGNGSDVGKTTVSIGIMYALTKMGYEVQPFKVGPDYIDPGYHTRATGNASRNIDSFLMKEGTIMEIFTRNSKDICIVEGVRGLYEGISVYNERGSTAHIAKILRSPVIMIIDGRSITRSAAAIVSGFKGFDPLVDVRGVIVNNVSGESHRRKVSTAIEKYAKTEVLGTIPREEGIHMERRHLGLIPSMECKPFEETLEEIRGVMERYVNLERVVEIADSAPDLRIAEEKIFKRRNEERERVGIAYDDAFNFYYSDSFDLMELNGCDLVFFSPMHDEDVPDDIHGLYMGGGYPEVFSKELKENWKMRRGIKELAEDDMPIYAECGGLIYLSKSIRNDQEEEMVGFLPCKAEMSDRHVSFTINKIARDTIIGDTGLLLKGHEFHYTKIYDIPHDISFGYEMLRGKGIDGIHDGIVQNSTFSAYTHLHFASNPRVVENLVGRFEKYGKG
jgi:cobyrinic acid a,c-diamide synthase